MDSLSEEALAQVIERRAAKGDVLAGQLAGIQAAKRTSDLVPLCHPLPLSGVEVHLESMRRPAVRVVATVRTTWRTGVEMEALASVSAALSRSMTCSRQWTAAWRSVGSCSWRSAAVGAGTGEGVRLPV